MVVKKRGEEGTTGTPRLPASRLVNARAMNYQRSKLAICTLGAKVQQCKNVCCAVMVAVANLSSFPELHCPALGTLKLSRFSYSGSGRSMTS